MFLERAVELAAAESIAEIVVIDDQDAERAVSPGRPVVTSFDELLTGQGASADISAIRGDDIALLPMSSGTSGVPKAVEITHDGLVTQFRQISASMPIDARDRVAGAAAVLLRDGLGVHRPVAAEPGRLRRDRPEVQPGAIPPGHEGSAPDHGCGAPDAGRDAGVPSRGHNRSPGHRAAPGIRRCPELARRAGRRRQPLSPDRGRPGLRHDRAVVRRRDGPVVRPRSRRLRRSATPQHAVEGDRSGHWRRSGGGRGGRAADPGPSGDGPGTGTTRRRPRPRSTPTAGCTPATSAASTPRATST